MTDATAASRLRFGSLEGLRAWMAWWVVIGHAANLSGFSKLAPSWASPLFNASVAVNVFVMLSGFVIAHLLSSPKRPKYGAYLVQRAFRLWPAYLLALLPMILVPTLYSYPYLDLPWNVFQGYDQLKVDATAAQPLAHVLLHLTLLQGLVPNEVLPFSDSSILSPAWSLSLEWQFYLVAPLLFALFIQGTRRSALWVLAIAVAVAIFFGLQPWLTWRFPSFLLSSLPFFLIGMLSRIHLDKVLAIIVKPAAIMLQAAVVVGALVVVDGFTEFTLGREIALWLIGLHMVRADIRSAEGVPVPSPLGAVRFVFFANPVIRHLGQISYSTYILHIPVLCAWLWLWGRGSQDLSRSLVIILAFTAIPAIYIVSMLCFRFVEKPFIAIGKQITAARIAPAATGVRS